MPNQIIVLPPDAVFKPIFHPDYPALTVFSIVLGEAIIGTGMFGNGVFVREVVTDPEPIPEPTPPTVTWYVCKIAKLNIRLEPDSRSEDKGDIVLGQKVGVDAIVTEDDETWAHLSTGYYAAVQIGNAVYLEKVTTGG